MFLLVVDISELPALDAYDALDYEQQQSQGPPQEVSEPQLVLALKQGMFHTAPAQTSRMVHAHTCAHMCITSVVRALRIFPPASIRLLTRFSQSQAPS